MGNTYTKIAETRNEWQRQVGLLRIASNLYLELSKLFWSWFVCVQWARIVLVVERGVDPKARLENQLLYSQPMLDGRRAFVLRQQQTVSQLEFSCEAVT